VSTASRGHRALASTTDTDDPVVVTAWPPASARTLQPPAARDHESALRRSRRGSASTVF
jgi:hypothetical protein